MPDDLAFLFFAIARTRPRKLNERARSDRTERRPCGIRSAPLEERQAFAYLLRTFEARSRFSAVRGNHVERRNVAHPRQSRRHRLRPRRLYRSDLRRPRHAAADPDLGFRRRRPVDDHDRRRELSRLRRADPGPLADGADARSGRACRRAARQRSCFRGRLQPAAVPDRGRFGAALYRRRRDHRHRRQGAMAGRGRARRSSRASAFRPAPPATASFFAARRSR